MIKYSIMINGEKRFVSNSDLNSLYEDGKQMLLKAKTIEELERVRATVYKRAVQLKNLRVVDGNYDVARNFKEAYISAFEAFVCDLDKRIADEKEALRKQEEKRQKGENAVREMLANAEIMYRIGQKQSLIAILRSVKSLCADFGFEIPNQYTSLLEKSTSI